jgi:hypothetical protein
MQDSQIRETLEFWRATSCLSTRILFYHSIPFAAGSEAVGDRLEVDIAIKLVFRASIGPAFEFYRLSLPEVQFLNRDFRNKSQSASLDQRTLGPGVIVSRLYERVVPLR